MKSFDIRSYWLDKIPLMFSDKDVYDRCGYTPHSPATPIIFTGEYHRMPDGEEIPIIQYPHSWDGLERELVLKTWKGFIPIHSIQKWEDIFDSNLYLSNETEWMFPYQKGEHLESDIKMKKFSQKIGRHWKGTSYEDIIEKKEKELVK